jgi:hypothetical protein
VRSRIDRNLAGNSARYQRLIAAQSQITAALSSRSIDYVVMKGLSQWPYYADDTRHRHQYDIDIYVPPGSISAATDAARSLGYARVAELDPGADHLPIMIRKTGWTWRNDYYDPQMPPSLELHFRFWNPEGIRFDAGDVAQFWRRRVARNISGLIFPALDPVDGLSYSALHLIRHLLGGDLRWKHVYEIAHFLERSAGDDAFWSRWNETGLHSCRIIEGIAFRLATEWFHCKPHPAAQDAISQLPSSVRRWFALFASSAPAIDSTDKNELWLHFCLAKDGKDRLEIALRRLFPTGRARVVKDAHVPSANAVTELHLRRIAYEASFLTKRAFHHLQTLAPTLRGAYLWWRG